MSNCYYFAAAGADASGADAGAAWTAGADASGADAVSLEETLFWEQAARANPASRTTNNFFIMKTFLKLITLN